MLVKMEEYDICIRAATGDSDMCTVSPCTKQAEFDLNLRFDDSMRGETNYLRDICDKHLVLAVIDYMTRS